MSITQFAFGLVSGALLVVLGGVGMTQAIIDSSLMVVGLILLFINIVFWLAQYRASMMIKAKSRILQITPMVSNT